MVTIKGIGVVHIFGYSHTYILVVQILLQLYRDDINLKMGN